MRSRFDEQLALLNRELIEMGALCEEVIALSAQALTEGNAELARQGAQEQRVSMLVPLDPKKGYRLLQYLYENAVQPEHWDDVIADHLPALAAAPRGGTAREQ